MNNTKAEYKLWLISREGAWLNSQSAEFEEAVKQFDVEQTEDSIYYNEFLEVISR